MSALTAALTPLIGREMSSAAGTTLFQQGGQVEHLYLVLSGCLHLVRYGEDGGAAVMQRATAGAVLAESSIFSETYHCDGIVVADANLGRASMADVRRAVAGDQALAQTLMRHLAGEVQRTRARVEILSRRTVAERLDGWLVFNGPQLPARGSWRTIAEDIGVSPEALYRELSRRRA